MADSISTAELPSRFGEYTLLELVAYGGTSEIFRAEVQGLSGFSRPVIIKRVLPQYAGDRVFVQMLIDEAKLCARLQHPNIVRIEHLGRLEGRYFIAMEYVPGADLGQVLERIAGTGAYLPPELGCHVLSEALAGLVYAHEARDDVGRPLGIIHRDFNPTNILVSFDGQVKVSDFGIAKAADRSSKTFTGVLKGKAGYMSPEQVLCKPLDARSDVFTAGITLWELLTSHRLFGETRFLDMLQSIRDARVADPREIDPAVPDIPAGIAMRALRRDPDERFQFAGELKQAIDAWLDSTGQAIGAGHLQGLLGHLFQDRLDERPASAPPPVEDATPQVDRDRVETVADRPVPDWSQATTLPAAPALDWDDEEVTLEVTERAEEDENEATGEMLSAARQRIEANRHHDALEILSGVLQRHPEHPEAVPLNARAKQLLAEQVFSRIEDLDSVPRLLVDPAAITDRDLDHRAGFVLSLVDGISSYDDILAVSGMTQLEGMVLLARLLEEAIIGANPPA